MSDLVVESEAPDQTKKLTKEGLETAHKEPLNELENNHDYLEQARCMGDFYTSLIDHLKGAGTVNSDVLQRLDPDIQLQLRSFTTGIDKHLARQKILKESSLMSAKDLLSQAFKSDSQKSLLENSSQYSLQETVPGMYIINIDSTLFQKLQTGSQGLGVNIPDGISFVMIQRPVKTDNAEFMQKQHDENLPHEIHHIIWKFALEEGVILNTEENPEMQKAFSMYQDELMARLCSDGFLNGYSHLKVMNPTKLDELQNTNPGIVDQIYSVVLEMNTFLQDQIEPNRALTDIRKSDLILAAMTSTSFHELKLNLEKMKALIVNEPKKQTNETSDPDKNWWGAI